MKERCGQILLQSSMFLKEFFIAFVTGGEIKDVPHCKAIKNNIADKRTQN